MLKKKRIKKRIQTNLFDVVVVVSTGNANGNGGGINVGRGRHVLYEYSP